MIFTDKNELDSRYRLVGIYLLFALITGVIVYFPLMSENLVNNLDGIWHTSNFIAGNWEISLGRGLQRYADRARFGLVSSAWNSFICFALIGVADYFVIKSFQLEMTFYSFIFIFITIANPVMSASLTYSYMSVNFALAYFFAITSFTVARDLENRIPKTWVRIIIASILFAFSMAFYQAYICVYAVLVIYTLAEKINFRELGKDILSGVFICVILFGGILYYIITKLLLLHAGTEFASYRGANNVGIRSILLNLPADLILAYQQFAQYVFTDRMHAHLEFSNVMIAVITVVFLVTLGRSLLLSFKKGWKQGLLSLAIVFLMPVAACFICLIAVGNGISDLMAMGILFIVIMIYCIGRDKQIMRVMINIAMVILSWYLVSAVENDQIALREGIYATRSITENALEDIFSKYDTDDYRCIAFVGRAGDNPVFYKSTAYEMANGYAQFGRWSTDARNNMVTWIGITQAFCGVDVPVCDKDTYIAITQSEQIANMPVFPENGYMEMVEDVLVVKVSQVY